MKVKLMIKNDLILIVKFNENEYEISYDSDDKNIFDELNKEIITLINKITKIELIYEEQESFHYKIAHKIASVYKKEINFLRKKFGIDNEIELSILNSNQISKSQE